MFTSSSLTVELESAILRNPQVVPPETTVRDAIAQMNDAQAPRQTSSTTNPSADPVLEIQPGCICVVENGQLMGLFTERDVVRLLAQQTSLDLAIRQVMRQPQGTLQESSCTSVLTVLQFLQHHQIQHLPILDNQDRLVGLVTPESVQAAIARYQTTVEASIQSALAEQHQTETLLQQRVAELTQWHKRYSLAEQASGQLLYEYDLLCDVIIWGSNTEVVLGYSTADLPTDMTDWIALIHPDDQEAFHQRIDQAIATQTPLCLQYRVHHRQGHYLWIENRSQWLLDSQGEAIGIVGMMADVSDRHQATLALTDSERRLTTLISNLPGYVYRVHNDPNYTPEFISPSVTTITGYQPDEYLVERSISCGQEIHPDDADGVWNIVQQAVNHHQPYECEYRLFTKTGVEKWVWERGQGIYTETGELQFLEGFVTDITSLKQAQLKREQAEDALRHITMGTATTTGGDFFPALVRHISEALGVRYVLVSQITLDGFKPLAFFRDGTLYPPDYLPLHSDPWYNQILEMGDCCHPDSVQTIYPDNKLFAQLQVESYYSMSLRNSAGDSSGRLCIFHDRPLSDPAWAKTLLRIFAARAGAELERYQTAEALKQLTRELEQRVQDRTAQLQEREARYRAVMDHASDAIILADSRGKIIEVNRKAEELLGYTREELAHLHVSQIHPTEVLEAVSQHFRSILLQDHGPSFETLVVRKDGSRIPVDITGSRLEFNGEPIAQGIFRDIRDRKQVENALRESQQFLQTVLDTFPLSVFWKDLDSVYLGANRNFLRDAGLPSVADLIGKTDYEMPWGTTEAEAYRMDDQQVMASNMAKLEIIEPQSYPSGKQIWLETNKLPLHTVVGEVIGILGTYQDISDRKQAELALKASENRFRQMFDSSVVGMFCADLEGHIIDANDRFLQMVGYTRDDLNDGVIRWDRMTPPEYTLADVAIVEQLKQYGVGEPWEKEYYRKDGSRVAVLIGASVLPGTNEEVMCVVVDISERKRIDDDRKHAELALQGKTEELDRFFSLAVDLLSIADTDGNFIRLNHQWENTLGYPIAQLEGSRFLDYIHPEDVESTLQAIATLREGKKIIGFVNRYRCHDGSYRWLDWRSAPSDMLIYSAARDITERIQSEQENRQQTERERLFHEITQRIRQSLDLQTIFDTACEEIRQVLQSDRVGIFKFSPDFRYTDGEFVAEAVVRGVTSIVNVRVQDHCFGANYASLYAQGRYFAIDDIDQHGLQNCHADMLVRLQVQASLVMPLLCGETLWGLLCIQQCNNPRHWQQSEIDLVRQLANQLAIAIQQSSLFEQLQQELSDRQLAQQQLTERNQELALSNQELARATRLKDEFLANMSHELRTPLNAILGMTEGLQEEVFGTINEQQAKSLNTIENSASHLLSLINDILDVAKIGAGQIELDYDSVAVAPLCSSSLAFIKQQALKKRIQLETKLPSYLPNLLIDERRIRQVLINLLTNAVKFTAEGGKIILAVSLADPQDDTSQDFLRIAVTDTGIGIAPNNLNKLFRPFVQIDSALNRQYTGTGLGLALVKQIVELHGGDVGLTSELGVGSCFTIDLPCDLETITVPERTIRSNKQERDVQISTIHVDPPVSPLILLAEDNEANIRTVSAYLEVKGYRLVLAHTGQEAIALAQTEHPDLILMDVQMPGMDGLEAMGHIRRDPNLATIPIIALTALAMEGDRERCLTAGATEYLAKPVKLKQLTMVIQSLLHTPLETK